MSRPGEGRGLPGRRRGRSAAARAARGGGPLWPPRSRGGRTAGGADDCHAGLRDDGARRPRRLPRPGDGRRAAREGGERPRGWGGAVRPLPLRRGDAPRQLPVGATTRPLISPAFMFPRRGVVPSGGGGEAASSAAARRRRRHGRRQLLCRRRRRAAAVHLRPQVLPKVGGSFGVKRSSCCRSTGG